MTTSGPNALQGVPPSGSLTLSPNTVAAQTTGQGQTFTVQAADASGAAVTNLGVALIINGANQQQLGAVTNASGQATFSYSGAVAGDDTVQVVANITGMGAGSNQVAVHWNPPAGPAAPSGATPGYFSSPAT